MAGPKAKNGPVQTSPESEKPKAGKKFPITSGLIDAPQRILLYGPGGIGKTTLASLAPNAVFLDIEGGTCHLDVQRIEGIESWDDLRTCLQSDALDGFATVVLDSITKAEEFAVEHTLATVRTDKGAHAKTLEDYNWGKGPTHVYDTFLHLLAEMDRQVRRGRNVILIAHETVNDAPNPYGEDYIRYEPSLQAPKQGKKDTGNIRNRVIQWADHVLFIGYDVHSEDGKGKGAGTRTIYPNELPSHKAKSRTMTDPIPFEGPGDGEVWDSIFGGAS